MQRIQILLALTLTISVTLNLFFVPTASAAPQADVTNDQPLIRFPNTITFRATLTADADITSVIIEYGVEQLTCGEVLAKAFPQFTPGRSVNAEWTWDMRQSGSLPPGASIWWRWRYTDAAGRETVSTEKTVAWLDSDHNWQTITSGQLRLHYYDINTSDAQGMLNAGLGGLQRNATNAGLIADEPIDIYVYPNYEDMRNSILYESSWAGGVALPEHNIVLMGVSGFDPEWDQDTVVHELTHVLVGHFTFSCLGYVPQWLEEGLAVYSEGPLAEQFQVPLDEAIQNDTLLSIRIISGAFSEVRDTVNLSYAQSYSIVKYLIETYGQEKMTTLLTALRDGATVDEALVQTHGFNIEGLEAEWRTAIGAQPRPVSAQPTAQPTPTYVPTIVPISAAPQALQVTPTPIPTSSFSDGPSDQTGTPTGPPLWLTLTLLCFCLLFLLIIGVVILGFVVRSQNRKAGVNNG